MDRYQSGRTSTANNARAFEGDDGSLARKTRYRSPTTDLLQNSPTTDLLQNSPTTDLLQNSPTTDLLQNSPTTDCVTLLH